MKIQLQPNIHVIPPGGLDIQSVGDVSVEMLTERIFFIMEKMPS